MSGEKTGKVVNVLTGIGEALADGIPDREKSKEIKAGLRSINEKFNACNNDSFIYQDSNMYSDEELQERIKYLRQEKVSTIEQIKQIEDKRKKMNFRESMKYSMSKEYELDNTLLSQSQNQFDTLDKEEEILIEIQNLRLKEFSNNNGDKLPIVVSHPRLVGKGEMFHQYKCIEFTVENLTETDYKEAVFAVVAWHNGKAVRLCDSKYSSYTDYAVVESLAAKERITGIYVHEHVRYLDAISLFLFECTDCDGNKWESPLIKEMPYLAGYNLTKEYDTEYMSFYGDNFYYFSVENNEN